MVMFKARFLPVSDRPRASGGVQQQQQPQPQPVPPQPPEQPEEAPPIEKERGPQVPIKLPGNPHPPERVGHERERDSGPSRA